MQPYGREDKAVLGVQQLVFIRILLKEEVMPGAVRNSMLMEWISALSIPGHWISSGMFLGLRAAR